MENKCAFTIVAKNYIGLATILQSSYLKYNSNSDFFIIVADEFLQDEILPENVLIARNTLNISSELWVNMSFKYTLTEFCTSIKPYAFDYFFRSGYEKVCYFDPDIMFFDSITSIFTQLDKFSVVLTPHVSNIHTHFNGEHPEWKIMSTGLFNLGFCAMKNNSTGQRVVEWWQNRLKTMCFIDRTHSFFTDQKWMDWLPSLIGDELKVNRDLGLNLAPWNYFEREIYVADSGDYYVKQRGQLIQTDSYKLIFVHYSGYKYSTLLEGIVDNIRGGECGDYEDVRCILDEYRNELISKQNIFKKYINQSYSYSCFDNGVKINQFHRRLYNGLVQSGRFFACPFSTESISFYSELKRSRLLDLSYVDRQSSQIKGLSAKRKIVSRLFKLLFVLIGYSRYVQLLRGLIEYSRPETHVFLLKSK